MSREKDLAKNTLILSIGTFLPKFSALITIPIITSHLTKAEYGTYDLLATVVALLLPIVTLQIHSGAFRFLIDYRSNTYKRKSIITTIYFFMIPVSIATLFVSFLILKNYELQTRFLIVIYFFVDIIIIATQQIVRGLSNNKLYTISAVIQSCINTVLIVLLIGFGNKGLNGVLISFIVATCVGIIVILIKGEIIKEIDFRCFSFNTLVMMLRYSWPMIPNTLSSWVLAASDRLVLSGFIGVESVAVYAAANKIPQLFSSVKSTFIFAWQENASLALSDFDVRQYYSDMFDKIFSILSGIMAVLIGCTPILFRILIRGDYADAYPQMPILFMGMFFSALASFLGGIYVAHKRTKNVGITTMLAAACNLIIDLALVHSIGIYAASISTLVSYTLLSAYRMYDVKKFQQIAYRLKKISICEIFLVCMCIICWVNTFATNLINVLIGFLFAIYLNRSLVKSILNSITLRFKRG